jgi:hypothetical protein
MPGMLVRLPGRFTVNILDTLCFISSTLAVAIARLILADLEKKLKLQM